MSGGRKYPGRVSALPGRAPRAMHPVAYIILSAVAVAALAIIVLVG